MDCVIRRHEIALAIRNRLRFLGLYDWRCRLFVAHPRATLFTKERILIIDTGTTFRTEHNVFFFGLDIYFIYFSRRRLTPSTEPRASLVLRREVR